MYTLGLNAVFHDSSACLVKDGVVIDAVEEERFTHIKHAKRPVPFSTWELPFHAIDFCLKKAGIALKDVDHFAYSFDPDLFKDEGPLTGLFLDAVRNAPRFLIDAVPHHLELRWRGAKFPTPERWHFVEHHLTHAASAFHASPHAEAAVMTIDGRGEDATTTFNFGHGNALDRLAEVRMPHSLGLLYERVTEYLGFLHSSDEYKVMALASFGKPKFLKEFQDIVQLGKNGQYTIADLKLEERFGPRRLRGGPMEARHYDLAHSLQVVLEDSVVELARWLEGETGSKNLCLAGGVALNCVMNARIRDRGPFKDIWVQPAAGDAGTALGAALWVDAKERRTDERRYRMDHAYLGPSFEDAEIEKFLTWSRLTYRRLEHPAEDVAEILAQDKVIGWFQGPMEFGPRALGARSILASPIHAEMQSRLNEIKDREDFRPVAPMVLEEDAADWFVNARVSPFMLFVFDVKPEKAALIPAVTHTDGTARVQTVNRAANPAVYDVMRAFKARTGVPVIVNTSFNTRGEPVVCTPRDAVESFWTSPLD
ncbi:MAG: carbamoyltransferase, partial [Elusimicrobia bacterium]|nr:carbamoyltransferase [Elusimicrobiota bacterium]